MLGHCCPRRLLRVTLSKGTAIKPLHISEKTPPPPEEAAEILTVGGFSVRPRLPHSSPPNSYARFCKRQVLPPVQLE